MNSQIETLLDTAEERYLQAEELNVLSQYVGSLPERLAGYRQLRDQEISAMQRVADQLQAQFPNEKTETLERSLKNALLVLRYCAMGMLLQDETFVRDRLFGWLEPMTQTYHTQTVDQQLYRFLTQELSQTLNPTQMNLLKPHLQLAQSMMSASEAKLQLQDIGVN